MSYFDSDRYLELLGIVGEVDPDQTGVFASFFTKNGDYYVCNNESGYMTWLASLFDGEPVDDYFYSWSGTIQGLSTQGSGTN